MLYKLNIKNFKDEVVLKVKLVLKVKSHINKFNKNIEVGL